MLKRPSRPSVRGVMSPEQISAWVAPIATRWRKHRNLAPVSMAAMRGIEAKALRLGHTTEQLLASGGDAIAGRVQHAAEIVDGNEEDVGTRSVRRVEARRERREREQEGPTSQE